MPHITLKGLLIISRPFSVICGTVVYLNLCLFGAFSATLLDVLSFGLVGCLAAIGIRGTG